MPVNIGSKRQADFNDPLGLLTDCHRRIENFVRLLATVTSQITEVEPTCVQREALETSLRYFRQAAPKHTLDEEESLFPRLCLSQDPRAAAVLGLVQQLSTDHDIADHMHHDIDGLFVRWFVDGTISIDDRHRLTALLGDLSRFYEEHIAIEEREVFPLAKAILSDEELQLIGKQMADRRGVRFPHAEPAQID